MSNSTTTPRASVACNLCRSSKIKCINNSDSTRCHRCASLDLECTYTLKTSQLKKRKLTKEFASKSPPKSTVFLPDKKLIIETAEIFFENQYKGIFPLFHKPLFFPIPKVKRVRPTDIHTRLSTKTKRSRPSSTISDPCVVCPVASRNAQNFW